MARRISSAQRSAVLSFYRRQAGIYDITRWLTLHGRTAALAALAPQVGESVLDLGCGTGLTLPGLGRIVGHRGRVIGVDFSPHMLDVARRRVFRSGLVNIALVEQDLTTLDLGVQFDAVAAFYSLSMIPTWEDVLHHAARHVAPGGRIVVLDFAAFTRCSMLDWVFKQWLRANHTDARLAYASALRKSFSRVEERSGLGGYYRIVVARGGMAA